MASTYLTRTPSTSGNGQIWTYSAWIKRSNITDTYGTIFNAYNTSGSADTAVCVFYLLNNELVISGSTGSAGSSPLLLRDVSAWYHIVVAFDTTQASLANRIKAYINGVQISLNNTTYPALNLVTPVNQNDEHTIGNRRWDAPTVDRYFGGLMAHVHLIDGTAYDASAFGQTDATSGIWKPILSPSVTYGTNGFFLKFGNAGSLGTDSSGNANNFTLSGSGTQTLDTPSNVFATLNPLNKADLTYAYGNNEITNSTASHNGTQATLAVNSGKWYWETKYIDGATTKAMAGISIVTETIGNNLVGGTANSYGYYRANGQKYNNGSGTAYGTTPSNGSIIGVAFDADNGTLWFSLNGVWQNSATISEIENGTTTNSAFSGISMSDYYAPACSAENSSVQTNFGNGYFGTTAVATPESDSAGIGKFEYSVPSGYYALCTKNIATYG